MDAGNQPVGGRLGRVVERDAERLEQNLGQSPVRDPAPGRRAATCEDGRLAALAGGGEKLARQAALAYPGRPVDEHEARRCGLHRLVQQPIQLVQLARAPNQGRLKRRRASLARRQYALDAVGDHGAALAFHFERQRLREAKGTASCHVRPLADQHRSRLGHLLEVSRDVDCVARDELVAGSADRGDHLAGVDADPDRERDAVAFLEGAVELFEALEHLERGPDRPLRIVLVCRRHPEDGDDRVADVLLQRPAPRGNDARHRLEEGAQQGAQPLRVEPLAELGRADHVGEQDRRDLALLAQLGPFGRRRRAVGRHKRPRLLTPSDLRARFDVE